MIAKWPDFIHELPEADLPLDTLRGWLLSSDHGQVLFLEVLEETAVPMHSHGAQWGVVIEGEVKLTIEANVVLSGPGDSYSIPAGVSHGALLKKGSRAIGVFDDADRYREKS